MNPPVDLLERPATDDADVAVGAGADAAPPTDTVIPDVVATPVPPNRLRTLSGISQDDLLTVLGALLSSVCLTVLLFGMLTPMSGQPGFVVVGWVLFLVVYGLLVSMSDSRPVVVDKVMSMVLGSAAVLAFVALASVIIFTLWRGREALTTWNLYTQDMSEAGPADPITVGGIGHAIVGTLIIIGIAIALTVPLGLTCAVFLNETKNRAAGFVRTVVDAMTALPSILAGLFIFATWILILGFQRSGLAAAIAVSIMMLPIIIRSADVVLRLVPGNLREASVGARRAAVAHGVARGAAHGPLGPGHRGHPRHRPRHRRDRPGAAHLGLRVVAQRRPVVEPDGVAAVGHLRVRPLAATGAHRPGLRHRRRADGAGAHAVRHRPHPRWSPRRAREQPGPQAPRRQVGPRPAPHGGPHRR